MKKVLTICLVLLLTGCLNQEAKDVYVEPVTKTAETTKFIYNPGTYEGTGTGYNGTIKVKVTVSESKIKEITIEQSNEANYILVKKTETNENNTQDPSTGENNPGSDADTPIASTETTIEVVGTMDTIVNTILSQQNLTVTTDLMTSATVTGNGLIDAVRKALNKATL